MTRDEKLVWAMVLSFFTSGIILFVIANLLSCVPSKPAQDIAGVKAAYTLDLSSCLDLSRSYEEYDTCANKAEQCANTATTPREYVACRTK